MFSFIRDLFSKLKKQEHDPGLPMETLTTTIAYPDGTKSTNYRESSRKRQGDEKLESMLGELRQAHPHVAERISLVWGSLTCEEYLSSLLFDDRAIKKEAQYAARAGFSPAIMSLLMQLQEEHQGRFGPFEATGPGL